MNATPHFAVIGAGIAGLACAEALQQARVTVSVFDKSRAAGGRMSTRRGDHWQCDHGAQYFTARDPEFRAQVALWQRAGVAADWRPRLQIIDGAASVESESAIERFVGVPRMTAPLRFLADSLAVSTQSTIQQLHPHGDGWQLSSAEHGWLQQHFDGVVLALPAPQAASLLRPVASGLAALAGEARMRGSWALMLRFAQSVALPFDAAFVNHGPLRWLARNNSKPGRSGVETWLLHANAEWSEEHLEDQTADVAATLLQEFDRLGGPPPQAWTAHRWRYADSEPALDKVYAWDAASGVGLCGDWLNGGKVEGAWLSGRRLAQAIIAATRATPTPRQAATP